MERGFPYAIGANQGTLERGFPIYIAEIFQTTISGAGGIATAEAFGTATIAAPTFIIASGIPSAEAFGWASISDRSGSGLFLGPVGAEIQLPVLRWLDRNAPSIPVVANKQISKSRMIDGSNRFQIDQKRARQWSFAWEALTLAELNVLLDLQERNAILHFQNYWAGPEWYYVSFKEIAVFPLVRCSGVSDQRYSVQIVLEERS
jgi:hypothetical protein